ncbi:primase-helicase zinc-binding domain-containing protein [uncultured Thiodictyon sp.]|uniref:primase-helicase zinc-binding domain-containing protein n=1 Tax=uncultured Thiodictyon sp. TaxID=1846217 RepID=UPI0025F1B3FA|nr:primase-helicase zinc-binding domain-containing protein [uncultured Thiodictyon sp.]
MSAPSFAKVKAAARGHWLGILQAQGVPDAVLDGRHHPCACGGRDRLRWDNKNGDGSFICGGGGEPTAGDGFAFMAHYLGMTLAEALAAVAQYLGVVGDDTPEARQEARKRAQAADRVEIEAELLHELYVLVSVIQARVTSRTIARDANFRALRPDWRPFPDGDWERERLAARRIGNGLEALYGRGR